MANNSLPIAFNILIACTIIYVVKAQGTFYTVCESERQTGSAIKCFADNAIFHQTFIAGSTPPFLLTYDHDSADDANIRTCRYSVTGEGNCNEISGQCSTCTYSSATNTLNVTFNLGSLDCMTQSTVRYTLPASGISDVELTSIDSTGCNLTEFENATPNPNNTCDRCNCTTKFTCDDGYVGDDVTLQCRANAKWNGSITCKEVTTPEPTTVSVTTTVLETTSEPATFTHAVTVTPTEPTTVSPSPTMTPTEPTTVSLSPTTNTTCDRPCPVLSADSSQCELTAAWMCETQNWICKTVEWKIETQKWWFSNGCDVLNDQFQDRWFEAIQCVDQNLVICRDASRRICSTNDDGCQMCTCSDGNYEHLMALYKQYAMRHQLRMELYPESKAACLALIGDSCTP